MKVFYKTLKCSLLSVLVLSTLVACSFPFSSINSSDAKINDISGVLDYAKLSRQGFMGGSLFYNPEQPSTGPLAKGVNVAIRLGHVERTSIDNDSALFRDIPEKAEYGSFLITNIDKGALSCTVKLYDAFGSFIGESMYSVANGESLDINNDGYADIQYKPPVRKRLGLENAILLTFLSSQEFLNTSMFAVLPEQYSRSVYPSGVIGINPEGKFIVSKYEGQSATRSLIFGIQKGDYVVDAIEGKYQKVVSVTSSRNARSINESELVDVATSGITLSYKFTDADFADEYSMEALFSVLPSSIQNDYQGMVLYLDKLNAVLERKDLITIVAQIQTIPIPSEDLADVVGQMDLLSIDEVIQLNRIFMDVMYPDSCPQFFDASEGMSQILPLASLLIGGDSKVDTQPELSINARAASGPEFDTQRAAMETAYGKYNTVFNKKLEIPLDGSVKIAFNNSFVKVGIRGSFSSSWGNLDSSVDGVVFLNADTNIATTIQYKKNLFALKQEVIYPVFVYGPIVFKVTASVGVNVPLTIAMPIAANFSYRAAFAGMYEAGVKVGLDYGIRWKKKWIIKIPVPYCDSNGSAWASERTIYYVGSSSSNNISFSGITATINPNVNGVLRADISDCIYAQVVAAAGLTGKLDIVYESPTITGTATVNANAGLTADAGIGLKVPIINQWYGKKWNWKLLGPYNKELAKWQVFKSTI